MPDPDFATEIAAFHAMLPAIRKDHGGGWVVIVGDALQGVYPDYDSAIEQAVRRFPTTPFLIRNSDEASLHVPLVVVEAV